MTPHAADTAIWIDYLREVHPSVYLDVGAGDGYDCGVVKEAFPDCRCVAIEPYESWIAPSGVERYREVIGLENNHCVYHIKSIPGIHGMYSRISVPTLHRDVREVRTLDSFCSRENIAEVDALKIDVEGAAWDVIAGAPETFAKVKIVHIETEWIELFKGQRLESEVFMLLGDAGLEKVWENRVEELGQGDSIWIRK